jgi:hypothetical protein
VRRLLLRSRVSPLGMHLPLSLTEGMAEGAGGVPGALLLHTGVYVPPLHAIVLVGGFSAATDATARVMLWDLDTYAWRIVPSGTHAHVLAFVCRA